MGVTATRTIRQNVQLKENANPSIKYKMLNIKTPTKKTYSFDSD